MKFVLDATVLEQPITGVGRAALGLYGACVRLRADMRVVAVHRRRLACSLPEGIHGHQWGSWSPPGLWSYWGISLYSALQHAKVLHFPWNRVTTRVTGRSVIVLTLHDVIPLALPLLYFDKADEEEHYRRQVQQDLDCADLVITHSECSREDILSNFRLKRRPVVILNASLLPTGSLPEVDTGVLSSGYFVYVGGYERRKGLEGLVRVYRELYRTRQVEIPLVLVGEPYYLSAGFAAEIRGARAEGSVLEKGRVTDQELASLLQNSRALIYPSLYEGFGYPPLEAMAQGCPVITTRVSSMPEICGEASYYISPGDGDALASAILAVDRRDDLRQRLSRIGRERATQFTWERSAQKYLAALDECLEQRPVSGAR